MNAMRMASFFLLFHTMITLQKIIDLPAKMAKQPYRLILYDSSFCQWKKKELKKAKKKSTWWSNECTRIGTTKKKQNLLGMGFFIIPFIFFSLFPSIWFLVCCAFFSEWLHNISHHDDHHHWRLSLFLLLFFFSNNIFVFFFLIGLWWSSCFACVCVCVCVCRGII